MSGHYDYRAVGAQRGCDFSTCSGEAVGYGEVKLKDHSLGGIRGVLYLALCVRHFDIAYRPVSREWVPEAPENQPSQT